MLRLVPLASPLARPDAIAALARDLEEKVKALGVPAALSAGDEEDEGPRALLVLTGGTEELALAQLSRTREPALLLAHPTRNSLPAALEVLARARQEGRRGKIVFLGDDPGSGEELQRTLAAMAARRKLSGRRLGLVGAPSGWLVASQPDAAADEESWGIRDGDVPQEALVEGVRRASPEASAALVRGWKAGAGSCVEPGESDLAWAGRVHTALAGIVREHALDACTVRCFDLVTELRTTGCLALAELTDGGVVAGCEGDVPAAVTMMWLHALTGGTPFMANPQEVLPAANAVWLAHCTIARGLLSSYALRSHFESGIGVALQGESRAREVTLARLGGPRLTELFASDGEVLESGRSEARCRTQLLVRLDRPVASLLTHPLGNHHVLVPGRAGALVDEYRALYL